jgi:hypothetical protein
MFKEFEPFIEFYYGKSKLIPSTKELKDISSSSKSL